MLASIFKNFLSFLVLSLTLYALPAQAQISVDKIIIVAKKNERPIYNLNITNEGKEPYYIGVVVEKVENPGEDDESRVSTNDILISPKHFSINPTSQRTIRLIVKNPAPEKEGIYRIKFLPEAISSSEDVNPRGKKTSLTVIFSVGVLVLVEPKDSYLNLHWERAGNKVRFSNEGTTNILFEEIKHCDQNDKCSDIVASRLYPGNVWNFNVPSANKILFRREVLGSFTAEELKPGNGSGMIK